MFEVKGNSTVPPQSLTVRTHSHRNTLHLSVSSHAGCIMAERRGNPDMAEENDLPVYLARPGTTDQVPRQKYGGLFCSVQDAFDGKSIDFDALSVGQSTPRSVRRETGQKARSPASDSWSSPGVERRAERCLERAVETRRDKEVLQHLEDQKVGRSKLLTASTCSCVTSVVSL